MQFFEITIIFKARRDVGVQKWSEVVNTFDMNYASFSVTQCFSGNRLEWPRDSIADIKIESR